MLTKRTNILFSQEMWQMLEYLSRERGQSVGDLVRQAVNNCLSDENKLTRQKKALEEIRKIQKKLPRFKKINYAELINAGRHV